MRTIADAPRACKLKEIKRSEKNRLDSVRANDTNRAASTTQASEVPQFSFANESQLLVINEGSVEEMRTRVSKNHEGYPNETLEETTSRFRANIIVSEIPPFEEDQWQNFTLGDIDFEVRDITRLQVS